MADGGAWRQVDEGWGRKAREFATLSEPANCREYVALHHHLGVGRGDRLLDVACGAGLALELAAARGATVAGIDASPRLVAVAADRTPAADVRVGDMHALPWPDGSFDVVTSCRGIWGTTPDALTEARRVLAPGGRLGLTVWGHLKASPGVWALQPFTWAAEGKVANQAAMVSLGRPGAGEALLGRSGFVDVRRVEIPFAWEFPDPETYARTLATTGPAYEAIQAVGEDAFHERAVALAATRVRDGLPLRAALAVVGYLARTPTGPTRSRAGWLDEATTTPETEALFAADEGELGFVMNASRLWAHLPAAHDDLFAILGQAARAGGLSVRQRGILVTACASTLGDSYCSLAWGRKLSDEATPELAAAVLTGDDGALDAQERALAAWARRVTGAPNATTAADVDALRAAGFDDGQIFAITVFVALRLAFSTVNDALGARPDAGIAARAPEAVRAAVTFGRTPVGAAGPPEEIELGDVGAVLRRSRAADLDALQAAIEESRDHLRPFMFWADQTREDTAGFLAGSEQGWDARQEFGYLIRDGDDGRVLGGGGLHRRGGPGTIEIGYWRRADAGGRGVVTALARALTGIGLGLDGIERVEIHCDVANAASAAVPQRLGYRLEGIIDKVPQAPAETGRHQVWVMP